MSRSRSSCLRGRPWVPTAAALGPWRRDALHGGAVSGLLSHSLAEDGWAMARLTMNLMRRVPLQALRLVRGPTSGTRRVLRKSAELWAGQDVVATADALLLPDSPLALPPQPNRTLPIPDGLQETTEQQHRDFIVNRVGFPSFVSHAVATHRTRLPECIQHLLLIGSTFVYPSLPGSQSRRCNASPLRPITQTAASPRSGSKSGRSAALISPCRWRESPKGNGSGSPWILWLEPRQSAWAIPGCTTPTGGSEGRWPPFLWSPDSNPSRPPVLAPQSRVQLMVKYQPQRTAPKRLTKSGACRPIRWDLRVPVGSPH
jgi:hypothetical protein